MCGIFAVSNDPDGQAANTTLEGLKRLEYRGYDSWGVAIVNDQAQIEIEKHPGKIGDAHTTLPPSKIGLGHTRWATHGGVTQANAHPHTDCTKTLALVHNGIVENYQELKTQLVAAGHNFLSETDTEVIVHLIEEKQKTLAFREAVFAAFDEIKGANAIVVLDSKTQTITACKNSSPLLLGIAENNFYLGSDAVAFLQFTKTAYILEDGEAVEIASGKAKLFDLKTSQEKNLVPITLDMNPESITKGEYPHFFLKEVHEQPSIIHRLIHNPPSQLAETQRLLKNANRIALIGCGSAYHCALIGTYLLAEQGILSQAYQAHEFSKFVNMYDEHSVILVISQSGETIDSLLAAKAAKQNGAKIIGIINARGSSLERLADFSLPVGAGPEIAVVSSKAFTAQVTMLALLSNFANETQWQTFSDGVESMLRPSFVQRVDQLADTLVNTEHLYLIGKDLNYPAALEIGLKLKETTYLHAEGFAAGELKHGVLSLITDKTPCIAVMSDDDISKDTISNATEISARAGKIIGLSPSSNQIFSQHVPIPNAGKLNFLLNIILGQLLAYYLGIKRGTDPDKPRNLAKSVTVK